jgi:hypothetical protein
MVRQLDRLEWRSGGAVMQAIRATNAHRSLTFGPSANAPETLFSEAALIDQATGADLMRGAHRFRRLKQGSAGL